MELSRKRMFHSFGVAREAGCYDELPVLRPDIDVQVHVSRNDRPQPFFLVCEHDTLLTSLAGEGIVEMRYVPVLHHTLEPGDIVYVPGGTPTRIVPSTESVHLRYKPVNAGFEAVAWFCPACGEEVHRDEFDTAEVLPQDAYWRACQEFNTKAELRRCSSCGTEHAPADLTGIRWLEVADAIRAAG